MKASNYLIVGGGVGGLFIAKHLIDQGCSVTLIDNNENKSSIIAAGLINPLVFRRMNLSWRANEFIPYAEKAYRELESASGSQFFHPLIIRRLFSSEQERTFWLDRQFTANYAPYMYPINSDDDIYSRGRNDFGSGRVKNAFFVDTVSFIESTFRWLSTRCIIRREQVNYAAIDPVNSTYNGQYFTGIIFAEGVHIRENPWFNDLPVHSTKGELLTIESDGLPTDESLNRKCFVLPLANGTFKVGATYVWHTYNDETTNEGKDQLIEQLSYVTTAEFRITHQQAGMRPTTNDRRPYIGKHPDFPGLYVFNGLGTKGYMLAPLLSAEFCQWLTQETEMDYDVRLERHIKFQKNEAQ
jgi:glycine/D-amino acid oxidase-like deaminating enzyme